MIARLLSIGSSVEDGISIFHHGENLCLRHSFKGFIVGKED